MTERLTTQKNEDGTTSVWRFEEKTRSKSVARPSDGKIVKQSHWEFSVTSFSIIGGS